MHTFTFQVDGNGTFPFDMLRFDCCWPLTSDDAHKLTGVERRTVILTTLQANRRWEPTEGRWASFGWPVVSKETVWRL